MSQEIPQQGSPDKSPIDITQEQFNTIRSRGIPRAIESLPTEENRVYKGLSHEEFFARITEIKGDMSDTAFREFMQRAPRTMQAHE